MRGRVCVVPLRSKESDPGAIETLYKTRLVCEKKLIEGPNIQNEV